MSVTPRVNIQPVSYTMLSKSGIDDIYTSAPYLVHVMCTLVYVSFTRRIHRVNEVYTIIIFAFPYRCSITFCFPVYMGSLGCVHLVAA